MSPYHVDAMKDMFDLVDVSLNERKNMFVWKARDKAFSYSMSSIALGEMMMETNNTMVCLFPKGEEVKYKENFRLKFDTSFNNLPFCMKNYPYIKNSADELRYGYKEYDEETGQEEVKGANNTIAFLKITKKDIAKSYRAKIMVIDEAGEVDVLKALHDTNEANMMRGGQKFGIEIIGGTSNAIHKGYKDVCYIWDNAKQLDFNTFFISRNQALWGWVPQFDDKGKELPEKKQAIDFETGASLIDVAENYFTHREKKFQDLNDEQGLVEFKQNYPKDEKDAFMATSSSPFNIEELKDQKRIIATNDDLRRQITRGNIEIIPNSNPQKTRFVPNPYGRWQIYLHPREDLIFPDVIGIDTVRDDEVVDSPSKNAMVVYRPFQSMKELSGLPICIYHHRPSSIYTFFQDALLTCMHYNAMALIEFINNMIFDFFNENGGTRFLAWRPTVLTEMGSKAQNRWGVKPMSGAAPALAYAVEETKTNYYNHVFGELIDELLVFGQKNTDLADAYKWAILFSKEVERNKKHMNIKAQMKTKPKFTRQLVKKNGVLVVAKTESEYKSLTR